MYNLKGLTGVELELVKYRRDMEIRAQKEMLGFCKRYRNREKNMLGKGTRKPVKVFLVELPKYFFVKDQLGTLENCSVPCFASSIKEEVGSDYDVEVYEFGAKFTPSYFKSHKRTRPFKAIISVESIYSSPDISAIKSLKKVDLMIHHYPYSDIPTFEFPLNHDFHYYKFDENMFGYEPGKGEQFKTKFLKVFREKKKDVLGVDFVGSCEGKTRETWWYRQTYLAYVQNFIITDNYGPCGSNIKEEPNHGKNRFENKAYIALEYKFFFCFENTMSYNYVSEKFRNALNSLYSLPIYFGAQNLKDFVNQEVLNRGYKIYIDVEDFPNPKDLVDYLKYLDSNDTAYLEYFQWRFDGYDSVKQPEQFNWVIDTYDSRGRAKGWICRLCEKIFWGEKVCHFSEYPVRSFAVAVNLQ